MPIENIDAYIAHPPKTTVLNFGAPKSGKTRSLVTLMKYLRDLAKKSGVTGRPYLWHFDFDDGAASLVNAAVAAGFTSNDLIVYRYLPKGGDKIGDTIHRPRAQGRDIFLEFLKDFNKLYDMIEPSTGQFKPNMPAPWAFAVDSTTLLQEIIMDFVLCTVGHELGAPGTDARDDYGKQMRKITEVVDSAKSVPCVSVFNAHESLDKNDITGEVRLDPYFTGKLAAAIAARFGVVLYSTTKQTPTTSEYVWLTRPKGFVKTSGTRHHEGLSLEVPQDYALVL